MKLYGKRIPQSYILRKQPRLAPQRQRNPLRREYTAAALVVPPAGVCHITQTLNKQTQASLLTQSAKPAFLVHRVTLMHFDGGGFYVKRVHTLCSERSYIRPAMSVCEPDASPYPTRATTAGILHHRNAGPLRPPSFNNGSGKGGCRAKPSRAGPFLARPCGTEGPVARVPCARAKERRDSEEPRRSAKTYARCPPASRERTGEMGRGCVHARGGKGRRTAASEGWRGQRESVSQMGVSWRVARADPRGIRTGREREREQRECEEAGGR
ncbi:hypothetical protein BJ546DRAFT_368853 [Cryomyces antarcticus]